MGPSITDWIMVGITAIYVVATIAIFIANLISANSAKKLHLRQAPSRAKRQLRIIISREKRLFFSFL